MTQYTLDTMTIETQARALRAAYIREGFARLMARFRGSRTTGDAHA